VDATCDFGSGEDRVRSEMEGVLGRGLEGAVVASVMQKVGSDTVGIRTWKVR
jgi:hypothetical protein